MNMSYLQDVGARSRSLQQNWDVAQDVINSSSSEDVISIQSKPLLFSKDTLVRANRQTGRSENPFKTFKNLLDVNADLRNALTEAFLTPISVVIS
jgi:hypothetical protein